MTAYVAQLLKTEHIACRVMGGLSDSRPHISHAACLATVPGRCFYAVYSAMCPKGRGAGMTGSTTAGCPVPVDGNFNIRVFHFTPLYL
jgi:hypothetical protein